MADFAHKGLAESTRRAYTTAWNRYLKWHRGITLCRFVSHLSLEGLTPATIRLYLAGIRHQQIMRGLPDLKWGGMPKLCLIIKVIKQVQAEAGAVQLDRYPISPDQLILLKSQCMRGSSCDGIMLWTAACLCYFGCFRAGEITAPASGSFDRMAHLTRHDITVHNAKPTTVV